MQRSKQHDSLNENDASPSGRTPERRGLARAFGGRFSGISGTASASGVVTIVAAPAPSRSGTEAQSIGTAVTIRLATISDTGAILALYRRVAADPGGLARLESEVDEAYVSNFVAKSLDNGIVQVAANDGGRIVGEIHACSPGLYCFAHVLSDLTIAVDPDAQGGGIGRLLFQSLLDRVIDERPDIGRIELVARESNTRALRFYESLGFVKEGRLVGRIRNVDGTFECDIPMGWQRPVQDSAIVVAEPVVANAIECPIL